MPDFDFDIGYFDELFKIYCAFECSKKEDMIEASQDKDVKGELGEVCLSPVGNVVVLDKNEEEIIAYKISSWVDFSLRKDFIFKFKGKRWFAITDHQLIFKRDDLTHIGIIESDDLKVLQEWYNDFCKTGILPPEDYSGMVVPENKNLPQYVFRREEMVGSEKYIYNYNTRNT